MISVNREAPVTVMIPALTSHTFDISSIVKESHLPQNEKRIKRIKL